MAAATITLECPKCKRTYEPLDADVYIACTGFANGGNIRHALTAMKPKKGTK